MSNVSYRMTIDDNGASDDMLGMYANLIEEAFQLAIQFEVSEPNRSVPKQLLTLAAISGQVISTMLELGAIVEATRIGSSVGQEAENKLATLDELLPKLTALSLMLNYSTKGQIEDGQTE